MLSITIDHPTLRQFIRELLEAIDVETQVDEILLPGETRWRTYERQLREGIRLDTKAVETLDNLVWRVKLPIPW